MYPLQIEQRPAIYDSRWALASPAAVREGVEIFVRMLAPHGKDLWVAFGGATDHHDSISLSNPDFLLVQELERLGLRPVSVPGGLGILRFHRF